MLEQIRELAKSILGQTETIRDSFPDDLPNVWAELSPMIESIERAAHTIINSTK
jgi:hypothetical protein